MMIDYTIAFGLLFFWMIPWLVCHLHVGWWLLRFGYPGDYKFVLLSEFIIGVIPFLNVWFVYRVYIQPWLIGRTNEFKR